MAKTKSASAPAPAPGSDLPVAPVIAPAAERPIPASMAPALDPRRPAAAAAVTAPAAPAADPLDALHGNPTDEQILAALGVEVKPAAADAPPAESDDADDGDGEGDAGEGAPAADTWNDPKVTERPEGVPAKFKNMADFIKSFGELERRQFQPKPPAKIEKAGEGKPGEGAALVLNAETMATFAQEYAENGGKLKDETYARLEKAGYTREVVNEYAALKQRDAERAAAETLAKVGLTPEALQPIYDWASANIPPEEIDALNELIQSPNPAKREIGLRQVKSAYDRANRATRRIAGGPSATSTLQPLTNAQEIAEAVGDKRYGVNDAYTKEVEARIKLGARS